MRTALWVGIIVLVIAFGAIWVAARGLDTVPESPAWTVAGGQAEAGRQHFQKYGCGACHTIPGVRGANGKVGPPLVDMRERGYVAGMLANTPENLVRWMQYPQQVQPGNAMPNLNVSESDARDMAAYLYAQR